MESKPIHIDAHQHFWDLSGGLFGLNWPVCELAGSYIDVLAALQEVISSLSTEDQVWVLGKTASKFYSLHVGPPESHAI